MEFRAGLFSVAALHLPVTRVVASCDVSMTRSASSRNGNGADLLEGISAHVFQTLNLHSPHNGRRLFSTPFLSLGETFSIMAPPFLGAVLPHPVGVCSVPLEKGQVKRKPQTSHHSPAREVLPTASPPQSPSWTGHDSAGLLSTLPLMQVDKQGSLSCNGHVTLTTPSALVIQQPQRNASEWHCDPRSVTDVSNLEESSLPKATHLLLTAGLWQQAELTQDTGGHSRTVCHSHLFF